MGLLLLPGTPLSYVETAHSFAKIHNFAIIKRPHTFNKCKGAGTATLSAQAHSSDGRQERRAFPQKKRRGKERLMLFRNRGKTLILFIKVTRRIHFTFAPILKKSLKGFGLSTLRTAISVGKYP